MKTRGIVITIALISGLPFAGCKADSKAEKPPTPVVEVKTAKAEIADLEPATRAPASVFPREQANIASRLTARILKLHARKGDVVATGQPLVTLENREGGSRRPRTDCAGAGKHLPARTG